jgi:hypothetical protein
MASTEVSSPLHGSGDTHGTSEQCGLLPVYGNKMHPNGNSSNTDSQIQIVLLIIDVNNVSELSTERCCAICTARGAAGTDDISGGG